MKSLFAVGWAVLPLLLVADASDSALRRTEGSCVEISVGSGTVRVDEPHLKLPEGDRPLDTAFYLKGRRGVRFDGKTVWLSQQQIAELFGVGQAAISKHIKNIYSSNELEEDGTYSILEYMVGFDISALRIESEGLRMVLPNCAKGFVRC